jgi:hypothetical protein
MVGIKADILAAVISQQKNMSVLCILSGCKWSWRSDLREQDLVITNDLDPVRSFDINLRIALV